MNERTHFFIKIYLSHFIRKGWCWLCVKGDLETGTDCYVLTQVLLTIAALLSHLGWGCLTVGHWETKALCLLVALTSASCTQLTPLATNSSRLCPGYIFVWHPPASVVLPLIYTDASLDWRLGRGSICYNIGDLLTAVKSCAGPAALLRYAEKRRIILWTILFRFWMLPSPRHVVVPKLKIKFCFTIYP